MWVTEPSNFGSFSEDMMTAFYGSNVSTSSIFPAPWPEALGNRFVKTKIQREMYLDVIIFVISQSLICRVTDTDLSSINWGHSAKQSGHEGRRLPGPLAPRAAARHWNLEVLVWSLALQTSQRKNPSRWNETTPSCYGGFDFCLS